MNVIGNNIVRLRKKSGMKQIELAPLLGVSSPTVSLWEAGTTRPSRDMVLKLAEVFSVTANDILYGCDLDPIHQQVIAAIDNGDYTTALRLAAEYKRLIVKASIEAKG